MNKMLQTLNIKSGDMILISSDITRLIYSCHLRGEPFDANAFIDELISTVGEMGTIVFPTFNWNFCKGIAFNYNKTKSKVGFLSEVARNRSDFLRTQHPIYSFVAWGKDAQALCSLKNKSAFGIDSPFEFFYQNAYKNLFIDVEYDKSATFVHYCEEKEGVAYRYSKNFTANYIDSDNKETRRTYSMLVRPLYFQVETQIKYMHDIYVKNNAAKSYVINEIEYVLLDIKKACDLTILDIKYNESKNIACYPGFGVPTDEGCDMYLLATRLFPICRSLTGDGVRKTLSILQGIIPKIKIMEVPTGTKAFDWEVPKEWNIRDAFIKDMNGNTIISFKENNLHVVGYSVPMDEILTHEALMKIIHTQPNQPDVIPYVTSYYKETSGFCMSEMERQSLTEEKYHAFIDSELKLGHLTYGELLIKGDIEEEIFLSTYVCHPSMANNEISGPCVAMELAKWLLTQPRRYSYRIIFIPETIGAILYLSRHLDEMKRNIIAGFNITCVGDDNAYSYITSRQGDTLADRVVKNVMSFCAPDYKAYSFLERGSDERQYNAPGIDLPVCTISRSKFHIYPEYHTSADNLEYISPKGLKGAFDIYRECIEVLENNHIYTIQCLGEPQLGKRGLYPTTSKKGNHNEVKAMMDFIAYADGTNDLIAISDIIGVRAVDLLPSIAKLRNAGLLTTSHIEN